MPIRLSCMQASRLQSQALDRRLDFGERVSLRLHTAICDACTQTARQMDFLRRAMARYPGPLDLPDANGGKEGDGRG
jgi:hypothetical protein